MSRSVVIIGGGVGGLFTGAILAREGLRVTVLEKNATAGGGLQSYSRFGEIFDTGMHVVGGMYEGGSTRRILDWLGIGSRLHLRDVDKDVTDSIFVSKDGRTYRISGGRDNFVKALAAEFPAQEQNLREYVAALYRIADEVDMFYLRPARERVYSDEFLLSANALIDKYITDDRLRSLVAYFNPFYGGVKDMTPAYIHAIVSVLYINGPTRFAGGSYLLAEELKSFIERNGGSVLTSDGVVSVSTEGRFITGVKTGGGKFYNADYYVCAIHPCTFFTLLDNPSALPLSYRNRLDSIPNSLSAFSLNIKLKKDTFRYINHSAYYVSDYADVWKIGSVGGTWPLGFLYMTPPDIGQGEYATKLAVTAPMSWEEVSAWSGTSTGRRGEEYERWKKEHTDRILDCMEEIYPGFRGCVDAVDASSPLTIRDFYGVKQGSMCGFSKDCSNIILSQVPVFTKIPNLFLTGQNCNLHGLCGVSLTAVNTAEAIVGQNHILNQLNGEVQTI